MCKQNEYADSIKVAICVRFFGILLKNSVKKLSKGFLSENYQKVTKFWKKVFGMVSYNFKKNKIDLPQVETIESEMTGFF